MTAPLTDVAGRTAVICGACGGSGTSYRCQCGHSIDSHRDFGTCVVPGCLCSLFSASDPEPPVCPWCGRRMSACQCEDDEVGF